MGFLLWLPLMMHYNVYDEINPVLPTLIVGHDGFTTTLETPSKTEIGYQVMRHCCDRLDPLLGRIMEGFCGFGLEKPLGVQSLASCCGNLGNKGTHL